MKDYDVTNCKGCPIPTLGEWAMLTLTVVLLVVGGRHLYRYRKSMAVA